MTPASLTLTADGKSQPQGAGNVNLTATPSGFVNGDTASVISGSANCATTATTSSPVGVYPITCTVGTLSAANYTFGPSCPAP